MVTGELSGKPDEMLGGTLSPCHALISHPGGSSDTPSYFIMWKPGQAPTPMSHLP